MYEDKGIEFLLDEADTVKAYEERGRSTDSEEETEASALAGMDRVQQIEVVRGIASLFKVRDVRLVHIYTRLS